MIDPPVFTDMPDDDLVIYARKSLQGRTAFAELYRRYVHRVYRYLLAQTSSEQDAQDLTAQTFLVALEALPGFRGDSPVLTWLIGIARHRALDHFRKAGRTLPLEHASQQPSPFPEEAIEQQLQLEKVLQVLKLLSPERAEAIALHSFGGLTVGEVAQVMQKQEAAVRMLIHRAIQDLKQRLSAKEQTS